MSTHNICLYKEVKKKYTGCNLKTTEFLDCALIGVCAVIRSNTVFKLFKAPVALKSSYVYYVRLNMLLELPKKKKKKKKKKIGPYHISLNDFEYEIIVLVTQCSIPI